MFIEIKKLFSIFTVEQKRRFWILQALVVLSAFSEVVGIMSIGPFMALVTDISKIESSRVYADIYNLLGIHSPNTFLIYVGIFSLGLLTIATIVSTYTQWRLAVYGSSVGAKLSSRLYRFYMYQSWLYHAEGNSSQLLSNIGQQSQRITAGIIIPFMQLNAKFVLSIAIGLAVLIYRPVAALSAVAFFSTVYFILYRLVQSKLFELGEQVTEYQGQRFKLMNEGFGGIKEILLMGRQAFFSTTFDESSDKLAVAQASIQIISQVPRYVMELLAIGAVIILVLFLIAGSEGGFSSVLPDLSIFAIASLKLLPAFQQIYYSTTTIKANESALDHLIDDLVLGINKESIGEGKSEDAKIDVVLEESIKLSNVNFSYPKSSTKTLIDVSFSIPAKKVVGIVGPSGSGKSTIIDLVMGIIQPDEGYLSIDNEIISDINRNSWQQKIGYVPQSIFLADGSIIENIAFGVPLENIDKAKVADAVKMSRVSEFVDELPKGLDTRVGERGVQLSGGQRQRIGIARALYLQAEVLVFDEATSALDSVTESYIMESIHALSGKKTIILIAHRLSTVKDCDFLLLFVEGKLLDSGTYDHLNKTNMIFKGMSKNV